MTKNPKGSVILFPPQFEVFKDDKFTALIRVTWGNNVRDVQIDKERYPLTGILSLLQKALLELSEENPYEIK